MASAVSTSTEEPPISHRAGLRVCVLQSSYEESHGAFKGLDPYCSPAPYFPKDWIVTAVLVEKRTAFAQIRDLVASGLYDVFFNLCDGAFDEDRAGKEVVQALERFQVPHTGAASHFYEPSKEEMKMAAYYSGVRTSPFVFAYGAADIEIAVSTLKFPLIVKHYNGYSSIGMTKNSRCETADECRAEAQRFISTFGGALIEEFIEGTEYTVLVAESLREEAAVSYMPVQCKFPPGETFKHFTLKWKDFEGLEWLGTEENAVTRELREAACKVFTTLKGNSYARCDFRVDKDGRTYFLEINPQPGCFYPAGAFGSADFILSIDPVTHEGFVRQLIEVAFKEHARSVSRKTFVVRFNPRLGYEMAASRDLAAGEKILVAEEKAQYFVTKDHIERSWDEVHKGWFPHYCYPIGSGVYGMWAPNVKDWAPINHSDDPNAMLQGFDTVARRDIKMGESITLEYATFATMEAFDCKCGAANCRLKYSPDDYKADWVRAQYGDNLSPFVLAYHREKERALKEKTATSS